MKVGATLLSKFTVRVLLFVVVEEVGSSHVIDTSNEGALEASNDAVTTVETWNSPKINKERKRANATIKYLSVCKDSVCVRVSVRARASVCVSVCGVFCVCVCTRVGVSVKYA